MKTIKPPEIPAAAPPRVRREPATTSVAGRFNPMMPTTGQELLKAWDIPGDAWNSESVKVSRCIPGTREIELLETLPFPEYDLEAIAGTYGPGRYLLNPGPGPYSRKNCTINVSQEFAARAGWQTVPAPLRAQEILSQRTFNDATQRGIDPAMLQLMIDAAVAKAAPPPPPASSMDSLALVLKGFELAGQLQNKALDQIKQFAGAATEPSREPATIGDALLTMGPQLLDTLKTFMITTAKPAAPAAPMTPRQPAAQPVQTLANPQTEPPKEPEMQNTIEIPKMEPEEIDGVQAFLGVLQQFAGKLIPYLKSPIDHGTLASQLYGMLGPDLEESCLSTSEALNKYGKNILAAAHPDLADDKAAATIHAIAAMIRRDRGAEE